VLIATGVLLLVRLLLGWIRPALGTPRAHLMLWPNACETPASWDRWDAV
jgi:hypothetical protein